MGEQSTGFGRIRRSRREVIAGSAGAVGVIAAQTVLGTKAAFAGTDGDVVLGQTNTAPGVTVINNPSGAAFVANGSGFSTGIEGSSPIGPGVAGFSDSGNGVQGHSNSLSGVQGISSNSATSGVFGDNDSGGNGVDGHSNSAQASGVFGQNDGTGFGVAGRADGGTGLFGNSLNTTGVWASTQGGTALKVTAGTGGTGIKATAPGTALNVSGTSLFTGKTKFSRSGVVTVAAGTASKAVTLAGVSTSSMVLATAQQSAGVYVKAAVPASGSLTIYLTGNAPTGGLRVAWFVLN